MLELGEPFPHFSLTAHDHSTVAATDLRGAPHLVFFLPKPHSAASRRQLEGFRNAWPQIQNANLTVYGVTYDTPDENRATAKEMRIPFLLLSDSNHILAEDADATAWFFKFPARMSFLMDAGGEIKKIYSAVKVLSHAEDVLADLQQMGLQPARIAS